MPAASALNDTDNHKIQLTAEGFAEIEKELKELEEVKLPETVRRVEAARQYGDLSENSEYHNAKEDQELLQTRINELETVLHNATIVKQSHTTSAVGVGSAVTVNVTGGKAKKKATYHIVGEFEADPKVGKISSASPLGKALIGKKKGDKVDVKAPAGTMTYEIVEIK
jgi:transcription elongation factor GreA